ncbi:hypothetical protein Droror1_Dr00008209 [Drosera rotundifolia]
MSKLLARIAAYFSNRSFAGVDKAGNRYFSRNEVIDGIMKEKRWVIFKGEEDPTSIPVEWICWLNGQRKRAPTPEEMAELEGRRERTRQNVERLKKEEQERKARPGTSLRGTIIDEFCRKSAGPDLQSFLRQVPTESGGVQGEAAPDGSRDTRTSSETEIEEGSQETMPRETPSPRSSEPTGTGQSFKPGTWQPPV